ncbi:ABC-2 type transport system permease protein [Enterococcus sp. PF1-24]|uniref:ABC transporter permease n=1 Tax=unclassified Enterococcus TaxID=2608891 RepID=UPI002476D55B|nr:MULTISPECIES: ABC transporter permease [unclassified Enterococcus]MDH6365537.1 ABC-2 type transport system permease protein [Enterococcus sp. PFB1-1]MDH6402638.1 ABC-2 type transport system permease protein [Enterococcus sp. PF1-24]
MFIHLYKYRLKTLSKDKTLLFWTLAFPILLGVMFNVAFSNLDQADVLETTNVAIVSDSSQESQLFTHYLKELKSEDKQLYITKEMDETKAQKLLAENEISGIFYFSEDTIELQIQEQEIPQTILQTFLNQYLQKQALIANLAAENNQLTEADWQELTNVNHYMEENPQSRKGSQKFYYFFSLIGMAVMYGFMWGIRGTRDEQANQSAKGIRLNMIPHSKLLVMISGLAASFTLLMTEIVLLLLIFHNLFHIDFSNHWGYILLTCGIGSITALSFGSFISNRVKTGQTQQDGLAISITMLMSICAGMTGTTSLKLWIDTNLPIINKLNPVNLIGESLYQLYYYNSLEPFFMNLLYLTLLTIFFVVFGFILERRAQYDHL